MHYLIAAVLWFGFIAWIVRASSTEADGQPSRFRWVGRLSLGAAAAACAALVAVATGTMPLLQDPVPAPSYAIPVAARVPAPRYASAPVPLPVGVAAPMAAPARVRVMPGTGLRAQPSRTAAVLRVAHQGGVLKRFGAANGWIQVGVAQPEGWVLESAATPAG